MNTSKEKSETRRLPMMPIRDVVIFPHMMTPFVVGRESSVRALDEALAGDKKIFLATQHDASVDEPRPDEIFSVGTIANIVQHLRMRLGGNAELGPSAEILARQLKHLTRLVDDLMDVALIPWEFPRLCRGGSRSLTFPGVVSGDPSMKLRFVSRQSTRTKEFHRWTSSKA